MSFLIRLIRGNNTSPMAEIDLALEGVIRILGVIVLIVPFVFDFIMPSHIPLGYKAEFNPDNWGKTWMCFAVTILGVAAMVTCYTVAYRYEQFRIPINIDRTHFPEDLFELGRLTRVGCILLAFWVMCLQCTSMAPLFDTTYNQWIVPNLVCMAAIGGVTWYYVRRIRKFLRNKPADWNPIKLDGTDMLDRLN